MVDDTYTGLEGVMPKTKGKPTPAEIAKGLLLGAEVIYYAAPASDGTEDPCPYFAVSHDGTTDVGGFATAEEALAEFLEQTEELRRPLK